jgi:hypothetical protein
LEIQEDNHIVEPTLTQRQRVQRITDILAHSHFKFYRRRIASACR